jgi:hypothetical protein
MKSRAAADVIAFLAGCEERGESVHLGPRSCSRCGAERDLEHQRYCAECRREYRAERRKSKRPSVSFHGLYPELSAFLFLRRRSVARGATHPITDQDFIVDLLATAAPTACTQQ